MSLGNETFLPLTLLLSNRLTRPLTLACAPFSLVGWGALRCHRGDLPYLLDSSCPEVVGYQVGGLTMGRGRGRAEQGTLHTCSASVSRDFLFNSSCVSCNNSVSINLI